MTVPRHALATTNRTARANWSPDPSARVEYGPSGIQSNGRATMILIAKRP